MRTRRIFSPVTTSKRVLAWIKGACDPTTPRVGLDGVLTGVRSRCGIPPNGGPGMRRPGASRACVTWWRDVNVGRTRSRMDLSSTEPCCRIPRSDHSSFCSAMDELYTEAMIRRLTTLSPRRFPDEVLICVNATFTALRTSSERMSIGTGLARDR